MGKIRPRSSGDLPLPFRELKQSANRTTELGLRGIEVLQADMVELKRSSSRRKRQIDGIARTDVIESADQIDLYALPKLRRKKTA